ncbi:MAG: hypothetical protein II981_05920 [Bacteroidales bacterium]|nr:hypothetical protein [Bacteroidales bacterium]
MSRVMYGSGKFVSPEPEYSHKSSDHVSGVKEADGLLNPGLTGPSGGGDPEKRMDIPEVPENPDKRPLLVQYIEEYFGKYWFVSVALILVLLLRRK